MKKVNFWLLFFICIFLGAIAAFFDSENIFFILCFLGFFAFICLLKYELITYVLVCFPLIDFFVRNYASGISSIWDELLFLFMIFVWAVKFIFNRSENDKKPNNFKQSPLDIPIILFMFAMLIVFIINSPDFSISFEGLRAIVQYILWYFVVLQLLKDEKSCKNLCLVFILVVGAMAAYGVYQYIIGVETPAGWVDQKETAVRTRVFSILTSPNILGSIMTLATPICFAFVINAKKVGKKIGFFIISLLMVLTLIFTFSRGAWIGFVAAMAIYIFLKDKRLIVPALIFGLLVVFLVPSVFNRITYMLSPEYIESSLRGGRLVRWLNGLKILSFYPIFGIGLGHFGGAVAMNNNLSFLIGTDVIKTYYMDNYYLKTAVESGLFGVFFLFLLMYQIFVNSIRTIIITKTKEIKELEIGILAGLFGVMIHNFVENVFEVPMMTSCFWVLVAVMMNLWYFNFKKQNSLNLE